MQLRAGHLICLVNKSRRAQSCCHDNKVVHSAAELQGREETAQVSARERENIDSSSVHGVHTAADSCERRRGSGRSLGSSRERKIQAGKGRFPCLQEAI